MEAFIVSLLIILILVINSLPFIAGALSVPAGSVYLGTIHWPQDYFYYLSQFAQGKNHWFWGTDLYTSEALVQNLVGWVNVFSGRIFAIAGIDQIFSYQLSILIHAFSFLILSYKLICEFFPESQDRVKRLFAFAFFLFSNAFWIPVARNGYLALSYFDYWYNAGLPINRLGGVPHHLLARTLLISITLIFFRFTQKGVSVQSKMKMSVLGAVFAFVLSSIDPVRWMLILTVFFLTLVFSKLPSLSMPGWAVLAGGLPMAIYLKNMFSSLPYLQLSVWENSNQLRLGFFNFVLANGPVMALGLMGLPFFVKKGGFKRWFGAVFVIFPIVAFYSPAASILKIVNVRLLGVMTTLFLSISSIELIFQITGKLRKAQKQSGFVLAFLIVLYLAPALFVQASQRALPVAKEGVSYISDKVYQSFLYAKDISDEKDVFLVSPPYNLSFPSISTRKIFFGHNLLTINYGEKERLANDFFLGSFNEKQARDFFHAYKISYFITTTENLNTAKYGFLKKVYDNGKMIIYYYDGK